RRLADAGISAEQDHRARDDSAPEDPVELRLPAGEPIAAAAQDSTRHESHRRRGRRGATAHGTPLLEGSPLAAQWTLPLPFEGFASARGTYEHRIQAGHQCAFGLLSARIRAGEITECGLL